MSETSELMTKGVAAEKGNLNKPLAMAWFLGPDTKRTVIGGKPGTGLAIGQIIGRITGVETIHGVYKGEPTTSLLAIGAFEAVKYFDGTVIEPLGWYGPGYFLKTLQNMLRGDQFPNGIAVALEMWMVASGKEIPYSYEVKDLGTRAANDPLEDIKRKLASSGRLRLPAPVTVTDLEVELPGVERLPALENKAAPGDTDAEEPDAAAEAAAMAKAATGKGKHTS